MPGTCAPPGQRGGSRAAIIMACFVLVAISAKVDPVAARPSQVHVSVHDDEDKLIFWWTTESQTAKSCVKIDGDVTCRSKGEQFQSKAGRYTSPWMHEVEVSGLRTGNMYAYQVGSYDDGWSSTYEVRTRPSDPDDKISFVMLGDQVRHT